MPFFIMVMTYICDFLGLYSNIVVCSKKAHCRYYKRTSFVVRSGILFIRADNDWVCEVDRSFIWGLGTLVRNYSDRC